MARLAKKLDTFVATGRNPECTRCGLCKTSTVDDAQVVCLWGHGQASAKIMFITDAPKKDDLSSSRYLTGKDGELFNQYLVKAGISLADTYVTSVIKCRPPQNRPAKPMETRACGAYLDYEIATVKPTVICLMGATALKRVLDVDGITKLRGKPMWSEKYGCWCVPTWSPAYVLRTDSSIEESEQFRRDLEYVKKVAVTGETGQLKVDYKTVSTIAEFDAEINKLFSANIASFDTETHGDFLQGKILTVQFSVKPGTGFAVPFYKTGPQYTEPTDKVWSAEDEAYIWGKLKEYLENPEKKKCGQNIKYDWQFCKLYGINLKGVVFDTMLAHYLLDENAKGQHDLGTLALKFTDMGDYSQELYSVLGIDGSKVDEHTMIKAPFDSLCRYGCKDADATLRVLCVLLPRIRQQGLMPLLQKMMVPLSFVLGDMEMSGVLVDVPYYKELAKKYEGEIVKIYDELISYPDIQWFERQQKKPVNFNSPDQMRVLFYDILKLPIIKMVKNKNKKTRGEQKPSTDKEVLEELAERHPIPKLLLKHRKLSKFLNTYVSSIPELVKSDGRLHTSYQQHITVTGRLSSSKPNLQNIPKREPEMANEIRYGIMAPEGYTLLESDEGQIEFRLWANESQDPTMLADLRNAKMDIHKKIASIAFNVPYEEVTKEIREKSKTITYSVVYGKSEENLATDTGLTVDQVKRIFAAIFTRYPKAKQWITMTERRAESTGEVVGWTGRRRRLSDGFRSGVEPLIAEAKRQAVNSPIQGGAHDILTIASLKIRAELIKRNLKSRMVMTIHDALILEVKDEELSEVIWIVKEKMEEPLPKITVPLIADIAIGRRLSQTEKLPADWFEKNPKVVANA